LQDTYFDLEVIQGGKAVEVPRAITDPGPICDGDFTTLKPGEKVTYELTRFATALDMLPAGQYKARVRVWRPGEGFEKSIYSPEAEFRVENRAASKKRS
jgi:hypothetical protein